MFINVESDPLTWVVPFILKIKIKKKFKKYEHIKFLCKYAFVKVYVCI